jgi:tetratricopeptide (TPR) repeat protein
MSSNKSKLEQAVGQAMRAFSKKQEIPKRNALLTSPLTTQYLYTQEWDDIPERRQQAVKALLQQFVNEYGTQEVSKRQREAHEVTFNVLYSQLRGQERPADFNLRERSYVRYRPIGYKMLADKFTQQEEQLLHANADNDAEAELRQARERAKDILNYLKGHPYQIDFFALDDLQEAAATIDVHSYYGEAKRYYQEIVVRLDPLAYNKVVMLRLSTAVRGLAHCLMNLNELSHSIAAFEQLTVLAKRLNDDELLTHGTHLLGVTYNMAGDWRRSLVRFNQALARVPKRNDYLYRLAWIKRDMIAPLITKRDFGTIGILARESLAFREKLPNPQDAMMTLEVWGRALIAQEAYGRAEDRLREARHAFNQTPSQLFHTIVLKTFVSLYVAWEKWDEARQADKQARALALRHSLWHQLSQLDEVWQNAPNGKRE